MQAFRLTLAYDGTAYAGWQYQPDQPTVQATVEAAIGQLTTSATRLIASGRTDAGVHARRQTAAFRGVTELSPETLLPALNATTPDDIHIWEVASAADSFHPIRDAVSKRYRYVIQHGRHCDIFQRRFAWHVPRQLDVAAMGRAAEQLVGLHDFASFQSAGAPRKSTVRDVNCLTIKQTLQNQVANLIVEIEANGFLYKMVRNIVGTLVQVGLGKRPASRIDDILAARDRRSAGPTAPAHGLTLWDVHYTR